jgi:predicted metal-binding protein
MLLVCRTCPRYDVRASGDFGRALVAAIVADRDAAGVSVRNVQCLGGCPDHGVAALDGPGKVRVRFSGLDPDDAGALLAAAAAHGACESGAPEEWDVPAELVDRISSVTHKRQPAG